MRLFKDKTGKEWVIDLAVGHVMRIKSNTKFNLLDIELARSLYEDDADFWELLWHIVEPQALLHDISANTFGENMAAKCLYDAKQAFFEEWTDFFQSLQKLEAVMVLEKLAELEAKARKAVESQLNSGTMRSADLKIDQIISERLNEASGSLLESLDAILNRTPGGNSTGLLKASGQAL